ncbi:MAG: sugar ABC transporter ATP-binding protein [Trueperaceae bacterium]
MAEFASLLEISGASKKFDGVPALRDADLTVDRGEVHALMGENGAGKSTLIRILAGVLSADSASIRVRGEAVAIHSAADAQQLGLRFIHQELNVVPSLSVAENIFLGRPYPGWGHLGLGVVNWRQLARRARTVLEQLGVLHIDPNRGMGDLSPGDAMLVSIARAFVEEEGGQSESSPRLYVMDEPTALLSRGETELLFEVIRGLRSQGCGILYVSHRMEEIFEISDRITVMRDGSVVATTATEDATPGSVIRQMTGRSLENAFPRRERNRTREPVLELRGLSNSRVKDFSLTIHGGEIVGVAGLAGSGRSELLRAIAGVDQVRGGTILLDGCVARLSSPKRAWQRGVVFVPEERRSQALVMSGRARENMLLPRLSSLSRLGLVDMRRERKTADRLARQVGLRARSPEQVVHYLSGGNQQKVVLARAVLAEPRALLLDEPTRGVDVGAKYDIYNLILDAAGRGAAVLMVSSDLNELMGLADRIVVIAQGRLTHDLPNDGSLEKAQLLAHCYGEQAA